LKPNKPHPVKLFAGILYSDENLLNDGLNLLEKEFGTIDFRSRNFEFKVSDYYVEEMGRPIYRIFISFEKLIDPADLANIKLRTNSIEERISIKGKRRVNIDSGYMDYDKVVLASAKYNGQKIYLKDGIWADLTLRWEKGDFYPYPWSFPDFKQGVYNDVFREMRRLYKRDIKKSL